MKNEFKLVVLWVLILIGMILHFNYHIGEIFYGIDVRVSDSGEEPFNIFIIRNLFYHLPVVWILIILYNKKQWGKVSLFVISILYFIAHLGHFAGELLGKAKNPSQISLLLVVLIVAGLLVWEHYQSIRKTNA